MIDLRFWRCQSTCEFDGETVRCTKGRGHETRSTRNTGYVDHENVTYSGPIFHVQVGPSYGWSEKIS